MNYSLLMLLLLNYYSIAQETSKTHTKISTQGQTMLSRRSHHCLASAQELLRVLLHAPNQGRAAPGTWQKQSPEEALLELSSCCRRRRRDR